MNQDAPNEPTILKTQIKHLSMYGKTNIKKSGITPNGKEIIQTPENADEVILRVEHSLVQRIKSSSVPVLWHEIPQDERIFFRCNHSRLKMKRLKSRAVTWYGKYGMRDIEDLKRTICSAAGGIDCFSVFAEYPEAHADVLHLLSTGELVSYGTELWDGKVRMPFKELDERALL